MSGLLRMKNKCSFIFLLTYELLAQQLRRKLGQQLPRKTSFLSRIKAQQRLGINWERILRVDKSL